MNQLTDDLGEPVACGADTGRIVSLVPALTEAVEVSSAGRLVGATDYCTHPGTLEVTRVGGSKYPRIDDVLALDPDLVLANSEENRPDDVEVLRGNGIQVWVMEAPATVPSALGSLRRLLVQGLEITQPEWLLEAEEVWRPAVQRHASAVVPVWRKPWVVLGRDTFGGDVLRRLGVSNVYSESVDRYPRPKIDELRSKFSEGEANLLVLPDEPYEFTDDDGPGFFPRVRYILVSGRYLTWYGPSLVDAHRQLSEAISDWREAGQG